MSIRSILKILISLFLIAIIHADKGELEIDVLIPPPANCVRRSKLNDLLNVHYIGKLENGKQFESSYDTGRPLLFMLGSGQILKGWEEGLKGMCKGEKRRLTIPPHLGYGSQGTDEVPAGSTLIFDIEIVDIKDKDDVQSSFPKLDSNNDGLLDMQEVKSLFSSNEELLKKYLPFELDESTKFYMIQMMFQTADKNRDGALSESEFKMLTSMGTEAMGKMGSFGGKKSKSEL